MTHKLTYWISHCLTDSPAYSFRAASRRACLEFLEDPENADFRARNYSRPRKIVVEYISPLDLVCQCLGEGQLPAENLDRYDCPEASTHARAVEQKLV